MNGAIAMAELPTPEPPPEATVTAELRLLLLGAPADQAWHPVEELVAGVAARIPLLPMPSTRSG